MRPFLGSVACCALAVSFTTLHAQSPVADALRMATARAQRNLVEAADEMPADKYGYEPTPAQMTFAEVVLHLASGNAHLCGWISGATPPDVPKLAVTDPKEKLVERLKSSFAFCTTALAQLDDSKLGDSIPFFGRKFTRAAEILALATDWEDHYSQVAIYLRLNGLLPPTAKRTEM